MFYKDQNISINKQIVAKVFKYQKKKFSGIKFFTPSKYNMQVGLMSHNKHHIINPHVHINKKKVIKNMSELLIIFSGKLKVYFLACRIQGSIILHGLELMIMAKLLVLEFIFTS